MPSAESEALWREAWSRLPLPRLAEKIGDKGEPRSGDPCPFCERKHKFGIFQRGNRWFFKCHNPECDACAPDGPPDEIGYLALRRGMNRKDAALEYLRLAVPELLTENKPAPPPPIKSTRPEAETMESANPWHALWKKLILTAEDRAKLTNKRGLDDATINLCGFRSNNEYNRELIFSLLDEFPIEKLVAEGIFKHERFKDPHPAAQLCGYGRTGKKDEKGKEKWDWTQPILIPYFDAGGVPFYLRPHKGGVVRPQDPFADRTDEDDDPEERPCSSHLYVPPGTAELIAENNGLCVFTEGEFKAAVGPQCRLPIIATPGTSFLKNARFRRHVTALLDEMGVTDLVIVYDNEIKDDPKFSNFKEDPFDRFDVQVWAEYAQIVLKGHMHTVKGAARIGWLPDELRTEIGEGKADFDGILRHFVYQDGVVQGTAKARKVFLKTVADAREPHAFRELFPTESRRIIEWKLTRKFHTPLLPIGGDKETSLAEQFNELDSEESSNPQPIDRELSNAFRDVIGCYYKRATVSKEERGVLLKVLKELSDRIEGLKAETRDPRDRKLRSLLSKRDAIWQKLRGVPERLSNFTLRCDYRLHGADGHVVRLVRILDSKDLKKKDHRLVRLGKGDLCGLRNFREWLLGTGDGVWHGGEKDLQNLCEDLDHQAFMRDIRELVRVGHDKETQIWFAGDKAYGPKGEPIYPDERGIYWHHGFGYQLDIDPDERGSTNFMQGVPSFTRPQETGLEPLTTDQLAERGGMRGIFKTIAEDMFDNIGGYDGWLALGLTMAYAIAPELLKMGGEGHPSPWFFGKLGEGKSFVMALLMRIWGFRHLEGILINHIATENFLQRVLSQYSCLPVFLDEARRETLTDGKLAILRGCYQRQLPGKATADYTLKVRGIPPSTSPMVGGESSSHDAATRSRFGHISVAAGRRIGDSQKRKERLLREAPHYYRLGDWLLSNRPEFSAIAIDKLKVWIETKSVREAISHDRVRFVHGVAFACMNAACTLLDIPQDSEGQFDPSPESQIGETPDYRQRTLSEFHDFLLVYGGQALRDVHDETFVNRFWEDIRQLVVRGEIKRRRSSPST